MTQESTPAEQTLWGGRFEEALAESALKFSASIGVDGRMYREDIAGSIAHVQMLASVGVITSAEAEAIAEGLKSIREEIEAGTFILGPGHEDVHLAIEARLIEKIGPVGGKLHTGRSRNDQVALDERLHFRSGIGAIVEALVGLQRAVVEKAGEYRDTIMPGYTHMQRAQPILLAHHLLAYVEMRSATRNGCSTVWAG
jgi:argininosuccinate lyase